MARNRMIKVEFWDDEKLATIKRDARLTFIGLWNLSDDYGVVKGNSVWLKNRIYPYDENLKLSEFEIWLDELQRINAIIPFNSNGEQFYYIKNFSNHQVISHPSGKRNPEPPNNILENSRNTPVVLTEDYSPKDKEKDNKKDKDKEKENIKEKEFKKWWDLYNKKIDKDECKKLFVGAKKLKNRKVIKEDMYPDIFKHTKRYIESTPDKQYRKNPRSYLYQSCWNNEIIENGNNKKFEFEQEIPNYEW